MLDRIAKPFFVVCLIFVIAVSLPVLQLGLVGNSEEPIQYSRMGDPPKVKDGVPNPYPIVIEEDSDITIDLHTQVFEEPNFEDMECTLDDFSPGSDTPNYVNVWIEDERYLHVQGKRDKVGTMKTFYVSCSDGDASGSCQFYVNLTDIPDYEVIMDEESTKTVDLKTSVFNTWGHTVIATSIDEAAYGEFNTKLLKALIKEDDITLEIESKLDQVGIGAFNVSATDGSNVTKTEIHVTVNNVNDPPVWNYIQQTAPRMGTIHYFSSNKPIVYETFENKYQRYQITATDVDGDKLVFSSNCSNPRFLLDEETGIFNFTPEQEDIMVGQYETFVQFWITATEDVGSPYSITVPINFTIYNINDQPINNDFSIDNSSEDVFNITFIANEGFDKDGDELIYVWNFGDGSDEFRTTEKTTFHKFPFSYTSANYTVALKVFDEQLYSERREQIVSIIRPKIVHKTIPVYEGMKGTLDLEITWPKLNVDDDGVEADLGFRSTRTTTIKGYCSSQAKNVYIYKSTGIYLNSDWEFDDFEPLIDSFGDQVILQPIGGDWDITITEDYTSETVDPEYIETNYMFRYAAVCWSPYGYDVSFRNASYTYEVFSKDDAADIVVEPDMEGSADLQVEITSVQVKDKYISKVQGKRDVKRTITITGTAGSDVTEIWFFEKEEDDEEFTTLAETGTGKVYSAKPSGGKWTLTMEVKRTYTIAEGQEIRNIEYCAIAWSSTDYDADYDKATFEYEDIEPEDTIPTWVIAAVLIPLVIIAFIAIIVGIIVMKKKQDARREELARIAVPEKEEDDDMMGLPKKPAEGAEGAPDGAPADKYTPTEANRNIQEVDASYANMFSADGVEFEGNEDPEESEAAKQGPAFGQSMSDLEGEPLGEGESPAEEETPTDPEKPDIAPPPSAPVTPPPGAPAEGEKKPLTPPPQ